MNVFSILVLAASLSAGTAFAQTPPPPPAHEMPPSHHMDEKTKAAVDACHTELKVDKPTPGAKITPKQKEAMDNCLKAKGITNPPPMPPHHPDLEKRPAKGPRPPKPPADKAPGTPGHKAPPATPTPPLDNN